MRLVNGMLLCIGLILLLVGSMGICAATTGGAKDALENGELNGIKVLLYGAQQPESMALLGLLA